MTVESASTSKPKLSDVVLTLSTVIEFSRSLLLGSLRVQSSAEKASSSAKGHGICSNRLIAGPE